MFKILKNKLTVEILRFPISYGINKKNRGFTYVELIVVLSIFAIMSSIVIFNYGTFQAKVDVNNYANDIALKIVQAQKDALSGRSVSIGSTFQHNPSYGVHFDLTNNKSFSYFADLDGSKYFDGSTCPGSIGQECLSQMNITKGNSISEIKYTSAFSLNGNYASADINNVDITFTRPSSAAVFYSAGILNASVVQITVNSPQGPSACIQVYSSGRIQIGQCK